MGRVLPILFNTDMVRVILDGRKTVTRRAIKKYIPNDAVFGYTIFTPDGYISCREEGAERFFRLPFQKGDMLYVQETWKVHALNPSFCMMIRYRADDFCNLQVKFSPSRFEKFQKFYGKKGWQSPYFMPKEAARIWLKVTDVRVERLHDITDEQIFKEGISEKTVEHYLAQFPEDIEEYVHAAHWLPFSDLWNSTIKKAEFDLYSWDANPWVWVIEFERCEKSEERR